MISPMAILKLLKAAKAIRDYVIKENNLDQQMAAMQEREDTRDKIIAKQGDMIKKMQLELFGKKYKHHLGTD